MSETLARIQELVAARAYVISEHAFHELLKDDILPLDIVSGIAQATIVEDYPDAKRGPTVLVFCRDADGQPLHAVWGIHRLQPGTAALITAYRPEPNRWSADFLQRRR